MFKANGVLGDEVANLDEAAGELQDLLDKIDFLNNQWVNKNAAEE